MALGKELRTARLNRRMTLSQVAAQTRVKVQLIDAIEREDFAQIAAPIYVKGFIKLFAGCVGLDAKPLLDEYVTGFVPVKNPPGFEPDNFVVNRDGSVTRKLAIPLAGLEESPAVPVAPVPTPVQPLPEPEPTPARRQGRGSKAAPVDDTPDLFSFPQDNVEAAPGPEPVLPTPVTVSAAGMDRASAPAEAESCTDAGIGRFFNAPTRLVLLIIGILLLSALLLSGIYRLFARAPAETRVPTTDLSVPPTPKPLLAPTVTNRPPLRIAIEPTASYAK